MSLCAFDCKYLMCESVFKKTFHFEIIDTGLTELGLCQSVSTQVQFKTLADVLRFRNSLLSYL